MNTKTKKTLDKFYTRRDVASRLIDVAGSILGLDLKGESPSLEPSAGDGAFSSQLGDVVAYDLEPESPDIIRQDFLEDFNIPNCGSRVAIGNPPFGKKGKLALKFLNKCGEKCRAVCFILPSTFRRWSIQHNVGKNLRLIHDETLPLDSFEFDGKPYSLNCVFQIWTREMRPDLPDLRILEKPPISHPDLTLWQYNGSEDSYKYLYEDWDVATYRQGYKDYSNVFKRDTNFDKVKDTMNNGIQIMFIKFNNPNAKKVFEQMDLNALAKRNLSTPGFGKADFVAEYGKYLKQMSFEEDER